VVCACIFPSSKTDAKICIVTVNEEYSRVKYHCRKKPATE
jgi:hypothetical protein